MTTTDETAALPLNLHEYEAAARALLSPMVFDFVAGGSGDEVTLRGNRAAFDRWRLAAPGAARAARGLDGDLGPRSGHRAAGADCAVVAAPAVS